MLRGHHARGIAISLARNDRHLRNGGFGERKQQLRPVLDDPAELLLRPRKKAGHILKRDQWNVEGIAEPHKSRALDARIDIQYTSQERRLIGNDAHRPPIQPRETYNQILRKMLVHL